MKKAVSIILTFSLTTCLLIVGISIGTGYLLQAYINSGAKHLVGLEKLGKLSKTYGYVWQEINATKQMKTSLTPTVKDENTKIQSHYRDRNTSSEFPSLAAVAELNKLKTVHKIIRVNDRNGIILAQIQSTQTSITITDLNDILLKTLIATEDKHFYTRKHAWDYNALLRATLKSILVSFRTHTLHYPRGSSTIHMQVARFLLMQYDSRGYAYAEKSIRRKIRELKLAEALRLLYSNEEILTVYINHCVSAGRGMLGYYDISIGLFGIPPDKLTIPQSLYLARLVKWNRHVPDKIINQIRGSLPTLARLFSWNDTTVRTVEKGLDTLTFRQQQPLIPANSYLLDLANEYWRKICRNKGMSDKQIAEVDIVDPESMIRRYGNITIDLTIDYRLQKKLERMVAGRGFGPDTTIRTDIFLYSMGENLIRPGSLPTDTSRKLWIIKNDTLLGKTTASASVHLFPGDTVVCNIRYKKISPDSIRRSIYYYKRDTLHVPGQYYAYALMDAKNNQLLAYYSKDILGSRLQSLIVNKNPNGSSVAKPIIYALAYDLGIYKPADAATDNQEIGDSCFWSRTLFYENKNPIGMIYHHVPEASGYYVQNYSHGFDGYDFLFNHLSHSNNILAVETMYRLSTDLKENSEQTRNINKLLERLAFKLPTAEKQLPGPLLYGSLVATLRGLSVPIKGVEQNYSVALGTLELSLYEQMSLFNILYNNKIILNPSERPSLFIKKINIAEKDLSFSDTLVCRQVFSSLLNIRPVHLALHKRLLSNPADHLERFDLCNEDTTIWSNFAKSGTTDDIIRPFNVDNTDASRTSFGLWNAVLRLRLTGKDLIREAVNDTLVKKTHDIQKLSTSVPPDELLDITIAAIGECNAHYTGERDGKTLHGYISRELLHSFGISCTSGLYTAYETDLVKETGEKAKYVSQQASDLSLLSRALIKLKTGISRSGSFDEITFERSRFDSSIRLKGKNYTTMLKFTSYMGTNSRQYYTLLEKLKKTDNEQARIIISQILEIKLSNQILNRDLQHACTSLLNSLDAIQE
jgi:membrane peptidoglycan carboxypeptidase